MGDSLQSLLQHLAEQASQALRRRAQQEGRQTAWQHRRRRGKGGPCPGMESRTYARRRWAVGPDRGAWLALWRALRTRLGHVRFYLRRREEKPKEVP